MLEGLVSTKKQEQEITGIKFAKEKWKSSCKDDMIKWKIWKILSHQKQWIHAICSNMDGPRDYQTKQSKLERERQIPYDITYMWNLKFNINQHIYKTETDLLI